MSCNSHLAFLCGLLLVTGCVDLRPVSVIPPVVKELPKHAFPTEAQLGDDLDIIVIREDETFLLINRTAHSYHNLQLWLNREYVAQIELIDIGTANRYELARWINKYQEPFFVPRFLAPDRKKSIAQAEIYDPVTKLRHRLVVRLQKIS